MGGTYNYPILLNIRLDIQGIFKSSKGSNIIFVQTSEEKKKPCHTKRRWYNNIKLDGWELIFSNNGHVTLHFALKRL